MPEITTPTDVPDAPLDASTVNRALAEADHAVRNLRTIADRFEANLEAERERTARREAAEAECAELEERLAAAREAANPQDTDV